MRSLTTFGCGMALLVLFTTPTAAVHGTGVPAVGPQSPGEAAERDWAAFQAAIDLESVVWREGNNPDLHQLGSARVQAVLLTGQRFIDLHPADARRWSAVRAMHRVFANWLAHLERQPPDNIQSAGDALFTQGRFLWKAQIDSLITALRQAPDSTEDDRFYFAALPLLEKLSSTESSQSRWIDEDWESLQTDIAAVACEFPESGGAGDLVKRYIGRRYPRVLGRSVTAAEMQVFLASPNPTVREEALRQLEFGELVKHPIKLVFTALDGRRVDLESLRGRVVLLDFWATWCHPCLVELPNVRRVYEKYRARGFEVIGISLDRARDKAKLMEVITREDLAWPQYFDGKYVHNEIALKFAISSIPATFLLDRDGRIVATGLSGSDLEAEVERLLKP